MRLKKLRIVVQSYVWNAAQFIAASLLALHKYVSEIQVFDGAWKGYPTAKVPWSTDGTEQIVKSLKLKCPLKWFQCKTFYESQVAKKTCMLKHLHPDEWQYLLADDELPTRNIHGAFERIRKETKALVGFIPSIQIHPEAPKPGIFRRSHLVGNPRLFKWQKGFHFGKFHNIILNAKNVSYKRWPRIVLNEMLIVHLKWCRHLERRQAQSQYQKKPH